MRSQARVTAVLGPTNTGKTHYAIERMLGHRTGVIGLPLRLLAREVYDRIVALRGPSVVALVTGEERIVPERTQYWVCTVEAMPQEIGADFVAIDEIQLCADPERGHVFTDRLLRARGLLDTMFMGSDSMRPAIAALVPGVHFMKRDRFSTLTWAGSKKISRMPPRSAIVGFSVDDVYAIAELIRRQKGGCAVVMGALSPRTRNAQVELYQNGDVEYLVATDAIGMGLNLDIKHVAFSSTAKFDGRRMRPLFPHELGQIAGRAGRHLDPGTFGVTGDAHAMDDDVIEAIEEHRFAPVRKLNWRNEVLEFGSVARLIGSLEAPTQNEWLSRTRESDDLSALKVLSEMPELRDRINGPQSIKLLWDVCRVPDFRGHSGGEHTSLLARLFEFLQDGAIPTDWLARAVARIDRTDGDIDALSKRLAYIRTWTYVAQRKSWVQDESHWRDETRAVEDRLSDALHARLTQRFVDRRTSVLMRRLKQKEILVAEVNAVGEVTVEGEFVGRLEGFRFRQDASSSPDEAKVVRQAAVQALRPEFHLRADKFYNAPDTEMDFTEQGGLMWGSNAVGKLVAGAEAMRPQVEAFVDEDAGQEVQEKVRRRLQHFIDRKVAAQFEPLLAMSRDESLTGLARGFAFRLVEGLGLMTRESVAEEVKALDQEARSVLRKHGVRFGQFTIFLPALLKPAPTRLRLVLWSLAQGLQEFPESPPPGLVTIPNLPEVPKNHYTLAGYHPAGSRAIRIDMLERLADLLRAKDSRAGFEATPDMLSITGMTLDQFTDLMAGLGYKGERAERPKVKPAVVVAAPESTAPIPEGESAFVVVEPEVAAPIEGAEGVGAEVAAEPVVEMESYVTFTWAPRPRGGEARGPRREGQRTPREGAPAGDRPNRGEGRGNRGPRGDNKPVGDKPAGDKPAGEAVVGDVLAEKPARQDRGPRPDRGDFKGKPKGAGGKGGKPEGRGDRNDRGDRGGNKSAPQNKTYEARPPRVEKPIDPDNPFAVLMALKNRT
ncbi:MAG: helicase-related protein [Paracoccaceae bacterium]